MTLDTWTIYVLTVLLLMSTPGPSQLLMLSSSMANGFRRSLLTGAGDLTANMLQMLAAGAGLGALILASETTFMVIKWVGVGYLVFIGLQELRQAGIQRIQTRGLASARELWLQGFITSAANPKAVLFFAALFPQFIHSGAPFWPQFLILSGTYIALDAAFLSAYGYGASRFVGVFKGAAGIWLDRAAGTFLIAAAVLLGLKSPDR